MADNLICDMSGCETASFAERYLIMSSVTKDHPRYCHNILLQLLKLKTSGQLHAFVETIKKQ